MKRHIQALGVRKWSGNDLLELQSEGLSVLDNFLNQYGDCIISGCEIKDNSISEGFVNIDGMVLPFSGANNVDSFPVYLVKSETHEQREYADGVIRDIAIRYYAQISASIPSGRFVKITLGTNETFFDKVGSDWFKKINQILQQLYIPTLLTKPTTDTLTYIKEDGEIYNFSIGQQCRVYDLVTEKYIFYQLYNIFENTADWQILGKGDGSDMFESPTLEHVPKEDTLRYVKDGKYIAFLIGQQCRVFDNVIQKYVFYQLYDINGQNEANWQMVGVDSSILEETVTINLESNQGAEDLSLINKVITISWDGQERPIELEWKGVKLSVVIPISVRYRVNVQPVDGYATPESQSYLAKSGNERLINFLYSCENVVILVTSDDGTSTNDRTVTVKHAITDAIIESYIGSSFSIKIPTGTPYKIYVDDWIGFLKPLELSYIANTTKRNILFEYERLKYSSIVFDKSISDPSNITGDINKGAISSILSKFRRCLCKKIADGEVAITYLMDNNTNMFEDGTNAILTGYHGDVMVDFPEFFYKREDIDEFRFRYYFAESNIDGAFIHVPRSLVGAYKAYMVGDKIYSYSGVYPKTNYSFSGFYNAAQARGVGYQLIDFQQHCVIAFMLYAKYGSRNIRNILGTGSAEYYDKTGDTDYIGNCDTTRESANVKHVNGLGIEGVYGGTYEWTQGVSITNNIWQITDLDGNIRSIEISGTGYIISVAAETGIYFDMIPTSLGGSMTTYYSDLYNNVSNISSNNNTCHMMRSWHSNTSGGVATVSMGKNDHYANHISTRLAFRGIIVNMPIDSFKELSVL